MSTIQAVVTRGAGRATSRAGSSIGCSSCGGPAEELEATGAAPLFLRARRRAGEGQEVFDWAEERLAKARGDAAVADLLARLDAVSEAAVPLATVIAQRFGPLVEERLTARKRAAGQYDFDDMLAMVADALRGPGGPELVAGLRRRFRLAIIDEFQDTDPVQWEIFRSVFHASGGAQPHLRDRRSEAVDLRIPRRGRRHLRRRPRPRSRPTLPPFGCGETFAPRRP